MLQKSTNKKTCMLISLTFNQFLQWHETRWYQFAGGVCGCWGVRGCQGVCMVAGGSMHGCLGSMCGWGHAWLGEGHA